MRKSSQSTPNTNPLFDGGKYATCKHQWVDADSSRDSIYLFDDKEDTDKPTRVCRFSQLSIADNQRILIAETLAHKCFVLKADNEQNSDIMNGLSEFWQK